MIKQKELNDFLENLVIKVDSREQAPYLFPNRKTKTCTLKTGDYSLEGFEDLIAIERKSVDDLIGSLTKGRERFERELERSMKLEWFGISIECSLKNLAKGDYTSRMIPRAAIQTLNAFMVRYNVHILFNESRDYSRRMTESILEKFAIEHFRKTHEKQ